MSMEEFTVCKSCEKETSNLNPGQEHCNSFPDKFLL